jgi:hypothetical protein
MRRAPSSRKRSIAAPSSSSGTSARREGGKRQGSKVRGYGVATSSFVAGSTGYDGLFVIKPDGRLYIQSGIGNLGTESMSDCHRVSAEMVGMPWEKVDLTWGNTAKNLPWSCVSGGSQTTHAHTRAAHAAAADAIRKLQEIAAKVHGGNPESYKVANERVSGPGGSMTLAQAAQKAIELGGKYDGHELPRDINAVTKASATALAGQGLMGVARDAYPRDGATHSFVAAFAEVEVDLETGKYHIVDYLAVADVGTMIHPKALGGQVLGARCSASRTPSASTGCTTSTTACAGASGSIRTSRRRFSTRRRRMAWERAEHSGSGDAGRRARHRRAAGRGPAVAPCSTRWSDAVGDDAFPSRAGDGGGPFARRDSDAGRAECRSRSTRSHLKKNCIDPRLCPTQIAHRSRPERGRGSARRRRTGNPYAGVRRDVIVASRLARELRGWGVGSTLRRNRCPKRTARFRPPWRRC